MLALNRSDLVRRIGYRDIGKAHQALSAALATGIVPSHMAKHLANALQVSERLLIAVMDATDWQRRDEHRVQVLARETAYRAAFRPHLRSETARIRPEPIFVAALFRVARLRHVPLPDQVCHVGAKERDELVKRAICDHYRSQNGYVSAFGEIVGYTLITIPGYRSDFGLPYNLNGEQAGPMRRVERLGEALLGTKRGDTRLTGLFKNTPIKTIWAEDCL
jgi:hypothetical protein